MKNISLKSLFPFLSLMAFFITSVLGQSTSSRVSEGNWLSGSTWSNGIPAAGYTITIRESEKVFIDRDNIFVGGLNDAPVNLIVYGILEFRQAGKLNLPSGSIIEIKSGGDFIVPNTGNNSTVLAIGQSSIRSEHINALVGPVVLNESNLSCGGCTPQPVNLLYFKARAHATSIEVSWASSRAWNFSHYELERSADGGSFEYIATIEADEFSNETQYYSYADGQPLSGTSYYRLKAVDVDGSFEYKEVAVVKFGAEVFSVYPNPSQKGFFNVFLDHGKGAAVATLRDSSGRIQRKLEINGTKVKIETEGLASGVYLLTVQTAAGLRQTQVLVQ